MSTQKNLITLGVAAVFALGLAACGGGGSAPQTTTPEPHPELTLAGVQMAMAVGADTYQVSEDLADALSGADAGLLDVDHPEGTMIDIAGLMLTCGVGPCRVTLNDDGTVTTTGTIWTAGYMPPPTAEEMTAAAATKRTAIAAEAGQAATADAGLGGSDHVNADGTDGNADDPYGLAISRGRDEAAMIKITDQGMMGDDDPQFMLAMDLGGGRSMHVRDNGMGVEEVVIVSTDIAEPTGVAFAMWEDSTGATTQALDVRKDGVTVDTDNPADSRDVSAAALDSATPADAAILALIMSDSFAPGSGDSTMLTFGGDDPADEEDEAATVMGTYRGAMGMYMCAGGATDCSVTVNAKGELTAMSDGWIFTPDMGATSDQPDYDYLHYGFWLKKTTEDGEVTYNEVETFAGSSITASGATTTVLGTATYEGGAVGVYVRSVLNSDGSEASATSGHFTADAMLMATFGQVPVSDTDTTGTIAPNLLNTLTGTINNFMLSGGEANMWSVALSGTITDSDGTATGTAKGGGTGDGSFSATFHGPLTAVDGVVPKPHTVVGEFNAEFTDGTVAGGFGAREKK